jgi:hypothetical protein
VAIRRVKASRQRKAKEGEDTIEVSGDVEAGAGGGRRIHGRGSDQGNSGLPGGFRQSDVTDETGSAISLFQLCEKFFVISESSILLPNW